MEQVAPEEATKPPKNGCWGRWRYCILSCTSRYVCALVIVSKKVQLGQHGKAARGVQSNDEKKVQLENY